MISRNFDTLADFLLFMGSNMLWTVQNFTFHASLASSAPSSKGPKNGKIKKAFTFYTIQLTSGKKLLRNVDFLAI